MPTRFLDLNYHNGIDDLRLDVSPANAPDVTLSHCWGSDDCLKSSQLTTGTLDEMTKSLPITSLPRVFQDTDVVEARVGFSRAPPSTTSSIVRLSSGKFRGVPGSRHASFSHQDTRQICGRREHVDSDLFQCLESDRSMKDASGGLWSRIAENYTKGALTREEDKLVAIQGTAKLLRSIPDDDHLAGL